MSATEAKTTPWPVRLPPALLQHWRAMASREGMTAAAALRRTMVAVLNGVDAEVGLPERAGRAKTGRLSITLPSDELAAVQQLAQAEGRSLANWVAYLVRTRLRQEPRYTQDESQALFTAARRLSDANRELRRMLPSEGGKKAARHPQLDEVLAAVREVDRRVQIVARLGAERAEQLIKATSPTP